MIATDNQELPRTISSQGFGRQKNATGLIFQIPEARRVAENEVIQTEEGRARLSRQEELGQVQAPRQRRRKT